MSSTFTHVPGIPVDDEMLNTYLRDYRAKHQLRKYTGENVRHMLADLSSMQSNSSPVLLQKHQDKVKPHNYRNREIKTVLSEFLGDIPIQQAPQTQTAQPASSHADANHDSSASRAVEMSSSPGSTSSDGTVASVSKAQTAFNALKLGRLFNESRHTNELLRGFGFQDSWLTTRFVGYFDTMYRDPYPNPIHPEAMKSSVRRLPFPGQVLSMVNMTVDEEGLWNFCKLLQPELALPEVRQSLADFIKGHRKRALLKGSLLPAWAVFGHDENRFSQSTETERATFFTSSIRMRFRLYLMYACWRNTFGRIVEEYADFPIRHRRKKAVDFDNQLCNVAHQALKCMIAGCEKILVKMDDGIRSEQRYASDAVRKAAELSPHRLMRKTERLFEEEEMFMLDLLFKLCQLSMKCEGSAPVWKDPASLYQTVKAMRNLDDVYTAVREWAEERQIVLIGLGKQVKNFWRMRELLEQEMRELDVPEPEPRKLTVAKRDELFEDQEVTDDSKVLGESNVLDEDTAMFDVDFCDSYMSDLSIESDSDHASDSD